LALRAHSNAHNKLHNGEACLSSYYLYPRGTSGAEKAVNIFHEFGDTQKATQQRRVFL
jgi:hypothetical protein